MTEEKAIALFKCLSDKSRLHILKSLVVEDMYVERLAARLGLSASTVSFHLKKLAQAGVPETGVLEFTREKSDDKALQEEREAKYRKRVIDAFFEYGKLKAIPVQRKKERIILEVIVQAFEHGKKYAEREVNLIIADFHDDFCTLRRDMISEGLLERDGNAYWRVE